MIEICTIIGTGIAVVGLIYTFIENFRNDIKAQFKESNQKHKEADRKFWEMNKRMYGIYTLLIKKMEK